MDNKVKILYLLNLDKNAQFLNRIIKNIDVWWTYINITLSMPSGYSNKVGNYVVKALRGL
jgi:hypothetical protein